MFTKCLLNKKTDDAFEAVTLLNNLQTMIWYLFAGFKTGILCSGHAIWFVKYVFLLKYDLWKLRLESWNTNHESLNRTQATCIIINCS